MADKKLNKKEIILCGKPLSEYPETADCTFEHIRKTGLTSDWNRDVFHYRYEKGDYEDLGWGSIVTHHGNIIAETYEIIAYTRLFATEVLDDVDMSPLIPYIELGLEFNKEYVKLLKKLRPIFDAFEKYGYAGKNTLSDRFPLEFWQGAFSRHTWNPDRNPNYS